MIGCAAPRGYVVRGNVDGSRVFVPATSAAQLRNRSGLTCDADRVAEIAAAVLMVGGTPTALGRLAYEHLLRYFRERKS